MGRSPSIEEEMGHSRRGRRNLHACRVSRLELVGSAARGTDFDSETNDANFLVEFLPPTLPDEFRTALSRPADLGQPSAIRKNNCGRRSIANATLSVKRSPKALPEDVDMAAETIGGYIKGIDFEAFKADGRMQDAVERRFPVVGEVLNQLSRANPELAGRIPGCAESWISATCWPAAIASLISMSNGTEPRMNFLYCAVRSQRCSPKWTLPQAAEAPTMMPPPVLSTFRILPSHRRHSTDHGGR